MIFRISLISIFTSLVLLGAIRPGKAEVTTNSSVVTDNGGCLDSGMTNADISEDDYRALAQQIFRVQQALPDDGINPDTNEPNDPHSVSNGLTLGMYVLRYLAEIGDICVPHKDIMLLVDELKKLAGEDTLPQELIDFLKQVRKIQFGQQDGKYSVKIGSINPEGIKVPIGTKNEKGLLKEIAYVKVRNNAKIYFEDVDTEKKRKKLRKWYKKPVRVLLFKIKALNQLHPELKPNIDAFVKEGMPIAPLRLEFKNIFVLIRTRSVFKSMKFYFKYGYAIPGMAANEKPLPSFSVYAKAKLLKTKVSVDQ